MQATEILKYEKELKDAGVPDSQAQIHASKLALIIEDNTVTKKDIENIRADIAQVNVKLDWLLKLLGIIGTLLAIAIALPNIVHLFIK